MNLHRDPRWRRGPHALATLAWSSRPAQAKPERDTAWQACGGEISCHLPHACKALSGNGIKHPTKLTAILDPVRWGPRQVIVKVCGVQTISVAGNALQATGCFVDRIGCSRPKPPRVRRAASAAAQLGGGHSQWERDWAVGARVEQRILGSL
jgi:hypothetical protein